MAIPALPDEEWRRLLAQLRRWAVLKHDQMGATLDPDIYLDAALDALVGLLERYDSQGTVRFFTYAYPRLRGAMRDAAQQWVAWSDGRLPKTHGRLSADVLRRAQETPETLCLGLACRRILASLPPAQQRWCVARYQGCTMREHADQEGVTESRISQRLKQWRMRA